MLNKAITASTAFLYSHCLQHHVPPDADLGEAGGGIKGECCMQAEG
jgi:hypothetical protein